MYLFSELQFIPLLLLFLLWSVGGWLMTLRWFDLEPYERGFIGFGMGMVVANWLGNFTARVLSMSIAFWAAAFLTLVLLWRYKDLREEQWFQAALVASAIPSLLSIFVEYSDNAGITATTRLLSNMFFMCRILAVPLVWLWLQDQAEWKRGITYAPGVVAMLGGVLLSAIEWIAIPRPVYGEFVSDMHVRFYEEYWDHLSPPSDLVFDPSPSRAPTLFDRQANSTIHWGVQQPCVNVLKTVEGAKLSHGELIPDFRRLADISGCK
jgi:hypothetical protein